jgi:hypothetical protein
MVCLTFLTFCFANGSQLEHLTAEAYFKHVLSTIIHGFPVDVQRLKEKRVAQEYNVPHLTAAQAKEYASLDNNSAKKKALAEMRSKETTFYAEDSQSNEGYSAKVFNAMETFNGRILVSVLHAARVNRKKDRDKAREDRDKELKLLQDEPCVENPWSYEKPTDRKHKMQLCKVILANADQILSDPAIRKDLPAMVQFIRSQTPEEPTAAQLPLMPLKYFNVFGHVLDSWRPHLEKHLVCAEVFKHIEYDLRNGNAFKYRTYDYGKPHRHPPTKLPVFFPGERGFKHHVDKVTYDTEVESPKPLPAITILSADECLSPRLRRQAMSPHSISYNALPEADSKKGKEETAHAPNTAQSVAAAKPNPLSPVRQVLADQTAGVTTALPQTQKPSGGAAASSPSASGKPPKPFEPFELEHSLKKPPIIPPELNDECVIS